MNPRGNDDIVLERGIMVHGNRVVQDDMVTYACPGSDNDTRQKEISLANMRASGDYAARVYDTGQGQSGLFYLADESVSQLHLVGGDEHGELAKLGTNSPGELGFVMDGKAGCIPYQEVSFIRHIHESQQL